MTQYEPSETPKLERACRDAHRAQESLLAGEIDLVPERDLDLYEVLSQFESLEEAARNLAARELGPRVTWLARWPEKDRSWHLQTGAIDFDAGEHNFGFGEGDHDEDGCWGGFRSLDGEFRETAFALAARAYRRECGWDFSPDDTGVWLVACAPTSWMGGTKQLACATGRLVAFAILQDRDDDDEYESLAHVWTATAWRRRGIASRLLADARQRLSYSKVEGPLTDAGAALIGQGVAP